VDKYTAGHFQPGPILTIQVHELHVLMPIQCIFLPAKEGRHLPRGSKQGKGIHDFNFYVLSFAVTS